MWALRQTICQRGLDPTFLEMQSMSDEKTDPQATPTPKAQDLMAKLKAPMTITAPTWAFAAAGFVALVLFLAALD